MTVAYKIAYSYETVPGSGTYARDLLDFTGEVVSVTNGLVTGAYAAIDGADRELVQEIESDLTAIAAGQLDFVVANDPIDTTAPGGMWADIVFAPANLNPFWNWVDGGTSTKRPAVVSVYMDGVLRWQGDVDWQSVSFDHQHQECSFSAIGIAKRLDAVSAEGVRRGIPAKSYAGYSTGHGLTGGAFYIDDSTASWTVNEFAGHALVTGVMGTTGTAYLIASNTATRIITTHTSDVYSGGNTDYAVRPLAVTGYTTNARILEFGSEPAGKGTGFTNCQDVHALGLVKGDLLKIAAVANGVGTDQRNAYWDPDLQLTTQEVEILHAPLDSGTSTSVAASVLNDTSKAWTVNEWVGKYLRDSNGDRFAITANTATQLTWSSGTTPTGTDYTILEHTLPSLTRYQIEIKEDLDYDVAIRDVVTCSTPYYRDRTPKELAQLLLSEAGVAAGAIFVQLEAFASDTVEYADMDGKSCGGALLELAQITCSRLWVSYHSGAANWHLRRRDVGIGSVQDLSARLLDRHVERPCWDQWADAVKVTGADDREVLRGTPRYGGSLLEVSSSMIGRYTWLDQVADRLYGYFGKLRSVHEFRITGEGRSAFNVTFSDNWWLTGLEAFPVGFELLYGSYSDWYCENLGGNIVLYSYTGAGTYGGIYHTATGIVANCDVLVTLLTASGSSGSTGAGVVFRATATSGLILNVATDDDWTTAYLQIQTTDWTSVTLLSFADVSAAHTPDVSHYLRVSFSGGRVRARIWATTGTEPETWNLDYTSLPSVSEGKLGLACWGDCDFYWDDLVVDAEQEMLQIGDVVRLETGGSELIVTGIREPLLDGPPWLDVTAVEKTGTALTPVDPVGDDIDVMPSPPVVSKITPEESDPGPPAVWMATLYVAYSGDVRDLFAFKAHCWELGTDRPEAYSELDYVQWDTGEGAWALVVTGLEAAHDYLVDVSTILTDGRTSPPCEPVAFTTTV